MIELTSETFHETMAGSGATVCFLHRGQPDRAGDVVAAAGEGGGLRWASLDLETAPDIAGMFGLQGAEAHLLMMSDKVVLYSSALDARPPAETAAILKQAVKLDMGAIRQELDEWRRTEEAKAQLRSRRICPTAFFEPNQS
ncbi:MAG: hypothetical protein ACMVY4_10785 [Minwuia sp.]|uniref:hypothetical protein n=1 Tax=Minwuia sp. TaxID=2493630 RepID=UPI003A8463F0